MSYRGFHWVRNVAAYQLRSAVIADDIWIQNGLLCHCCTWSILAAAYVGSWLKIGLACGRPYKHRPQEHSTVCIIKTLNLIACNYWSMQCDALPLGVPIRRFVAAHLTIHLAYSCLCFVPVELTKLCPWLYLWSELRELGCHGNRCDSQTATSLP